MKISVKDNAILIEEAYVGVSFKTTDGEELSICMRDSGFEFKYQGDMYFAKQGHVQPFNESARGNYLVDQTPQLESNVPQSNGETSTLSGIKSRNHDELMSEKEYQGCGMYEDLDGSQLL